MKKLFALLVMAIFLASTVSAEETFIDRLLKEKKLTETNQQNEENEANIKNIAENKLLQIKEQLRIRNIKLAESQENITELVKEKKEKCVNENVECKNARERVKLGAKNYLTNFADMVLSHLEKLKERIQTSENADSEEAKQLISDIDNEITKIEEIKANIDKAKTNEELKEAARNLKQKWKELRFRVIALAGKVADFKLGVILNRAESLEEKLNRIVKKMEEDGKDVSDVKVMIAEFNALITKAREHYKLAKEKFDEARDLKISDEDKVKSLIEEGKTHLTEAKALLKEANQKLKQIVKAIKGSKEVEEGGEE